MAREPGFGSAAKASALLRRHHLQWVTVVAGRLPFHLAEDEPATAPEDQIELVAAGPDVRTEHAIAAQPVVERGAALEPVADPARIRGGGVQAAATVTGSSTR